MFPDVYEFTQYMIFVIFQKMAVPEMGGFVKIQEFTVVIIFVIFPPK